MKYLVTFIHKNGIPQSNVTLVFGETSAIDVAKKCFEYGKSQLYTDMIIEKEKGEQE